MSIFAKFRPRSEFAANLLTMLSGTAIAQAIPVAISPLLTRIFTPGDFALFALYAAIAAPLGVAATARYEFAVMLPAQDEEALDLVWVALCIAAAVGMLTGVVVWALNRPIAGLLGNLAISPWLYLLPVSSLLLAVTQVLGCLANRRKEYRQLAGISIGQQAATAVTNVATGLGHAPTNGLIMGSLAGQAAAAAALTWKFWRCDSGRRGPPPTERLRAAAGRYHQFPAYNLPYSLVGNLASGFGIIALSMFGFIQPAGFLSLARRVMLAPISLLSASLGQVFFQEAAVSFRSRRLEDLTTRLLFTLAELGTPAFAFLVFWAPELFAFVFGPAWREAGLYAAAFSPVAFCFLFTSWPERIYEIAQQQHRALMIQVISDAIGIALLWGLLRIGTPPLRAVLVYALAYTGYHVVYLHFIFRIAGFKMQGLNAMLRKILALGAVSTAVLLTIRASGTPPVAQGIIGLFLLGGYAWWWKGRRLGPRKAEAS